MKKLYKGLIIAGVIIFVLLAIAFKLFVAPIEHWCEGEEVYMSYLPGCIDCPWSYHDKQGNHIVTCGGGPMPIFENSPPECKELSKLECNKRKYF